MWILINEGGKRRNILISFISNWIFFWTILLTRIFNLFMLEFKSSRRWSCPVAPTSPFKCERDRWLMPMISKKLHWRGVGFRLKFDTFTQMSLARHTVTRNSAPTDPYFMKYVNCNPWCDRVFTSQRSRTNSLNRVHYVTTNGCRNLQNKHQLW